ncbi:hypothetical protein GGI23_007493, partial [Coemansia sp. RSA 2559]
MCAHNDSTRAFVLFGTGEPLAEGTSRFFLCADCGYTGTDIAEFVAHRETHY